MSFGFIDLTPTDLEKEDFYRVEKHENGIILEHISYNLGKNPINGDFERFYGLMVRFAVPYKMIKDFELETLTAQEISEKLKSIMLKLRKLGYRTRISLYANTVFFDDCMDIEFERTEKGVYGHKSFR